MTIRRLRSWKHTKLVAISAIVLIVIQYSSFAQTPKPSANPAKPAVTPRTPPSRKPTAPRPGRPSRRLTFIPPPPPQTGRASVTRGAATRTGTCSSVPIPLIALVPTYKLTTGEVMGVQQTTSSYPTLWFYLPYSLTPERPAELRLEVPATGKYVTQKTVLRLTQAQPGIIGIQVPTVEGPMKIGQRTDWTFVVLCDTRDFSANKFVNLSVQRIEAPQSLQQQLANTLPIDQAVLYAGAGIWENALTTLATLRSQTPNQSDMIAAWAQLLGAINLPNDLIQQPVALLSTKTKRTFFKGSQ